MFAASRVSGRGKLVGLSLSAASLEFPCLSFRLRREILHKICA
ncbi:hypothetical protein [uncultured Campylobacter sp.]|nr:hypothetical protein [uncultured Campylobacter sp.]